MRGGRKNLWFSANIEIHALAMARSTEIHALDMALGVIRRQI